MSGRRRGQAGDSRGRQSWDADSNFSNLAFFERENRENTVGRRGSVGPVAFLVFGTEPSGSSVPGFGFGYKDVVRVRRFLSVLLVLCLSPALAAEGGVVLALSGGGTRGFAHIGVIEVLEGHKIPIVGDFWGGVI